MVEIVNAMNSEQIIVFLGNEGILEFINNAEKKHVIFQTLPHRLMSRRDNFERIIDRSEA
jgi:hypothetical protein